MEPILQEKITLTGLHTDRFGNLKPSALLHLVQTVAGDHCALLRVDLPKNLMWAIIRHRVQITRLPKQGQTLTLETWPMPTTRTAYPRSVIAYDEAGQEVFRSIALWVLMDRNTRSLVLPKNSGVELSGVVRGMELSVPGALMAGAVQNTQQRTVCFGDLDENGHMNNARYLDWIWDLLPSSFHQHHSPRDITMCYYAEAREAEPLSIHWALAESGRLQADIFRQTDGQIHRIFSAVVEY